MSLVDSENDFQSEYGEDFQIQSPSNEEEPLDFNENYNISESNSNASDTPESHFQNTKNSLTDLNPKEENAPFVTSEDDSLESETYDITRKEDKGEEITDENKELQSSPNGINDISDDTDDLNDTNDNEDFLGIDENNQKLINLESRNSQNQIEETIPASASTNSLNTLNISQKLNSNFDFQSQTQSQFQNQIQFQFQNQDIKPSILEAKSSLHSSPQAFSSIQQGDYFQSNDNMNLNTQSSNRNNTRIPSMLSNAYIDDDQLLYLSKISTKIQKVYRRDASAASRSDRSKEFELDELLEEIQTQVVAMKDAYCQRITNLKEEVLRLREYHETKVVEWKSRSDKLQKRWDNLMNDMKLLQYQKEEIRQERDLLLCEHKKNYRKRILFSEEPNPSEKNIVKEFLEHTISEILESVRLTLNAQTASVFLYNHPTNKLEPLVIVPETEIDYESIKVSPNEGIIGEVFTKGRALNILNIDKETAFLDKYIEKFNPRILLTYPLFSKATGTSIGCIQVINKEIGVFSVEDEARMSQFVFIISKIFECAHDIYQFGTGGGSVGYGNEDSMTDSHSSSLINVRRVGALNATEYHDIGFLQKHGALIPKYIEDFIQKLHRSWRNAVDESGKIQNKIEIYKQDKINLENQIRELKRDLEKKRLIIESQNKTIVQFSRESILNPMNQWKDEENRTRTKNLQDDTLRVDQSLKYSSGNNQKVLHSTRDKLVVLPSLSRQKKQKTEDLNKNTANHGSSFKFTIQKVGPYLDEGQFFTQIFNYCPSPIIILSTSYHICACNREFSKLLNYKTRELIGVMLHNILLKVDIEMLPRMLDFKYLECLIFKKRDEISSNGIHQVVKMDAQITLVGSENQIYKLSHPSRVINGPIYIILLSKLND